MFMFEVPIIGFKCWTIISLPDGNTVLSMHQEYPDHFLLTVVRRQCKSTLSIGTCLLKEGTQSLESSRNPSNVTQTQSQSMLGWIFRFVRPVQSFEVYCFMVLPQRWTANNQRRPQLQQEKSSSSHWHLCGLLQIPGCAHGFAPL